MTTPSHTLQPFVRQWAVLLTTYRRDGTPVGTPVNIAVDGDRAFVRTFDRAWKTKRLQQNPEAQIAPSTAGGKPTGPAIPVRARLLSGDEAAHAGSALRRKYRIVHGILVPLAHRLRGYKTVHFELTPIDRNDR